MKLVLFFLCLLIYGCSDNDTLSQIKFNTNKYYKINIQGHINKPGIYLIKKDSRVSKLIEMAKGYKNNAEKIKDSEIIENREYFINSNRIKNKIDLNSANSIDLMSVKGIGKSIALKILNKRSELIKFQSINQLMLVKGIKEKKFNKKYEYFKI